MKAAAMFLGGDDEYSPTESPDGSSGASWPADYTHRCHTPHAAHVPCFLCLIPADDESSQDSPSRAVRNQRLSESCLGKKKRPWNTKEDRCLLEVVSRRVLQKFEVGDYTPPQHPVHELSKFRLTNLPWVDISKELNLNGGVHRNSKQCRERFTNFLAYNRGMVSLCLRPDASKAVGVSLSIVEADKEDVLRQRKEDRRSKAADKRRQWTHQEDMDLLQLQKEFGNKWALIARHIPNKNDSQVKNRWYSRQRKQARQARGGSGKGARGAASPTPSSASSAHSGRGQHTVKDSRSAMLPSAHPSAIRWGPTPTHGSAPAASQPAFTQAHHTGHQELPDAGQGTSPQEALHSTQARSVWQVVGPTGHQLQQQQLPSAHAGMSGAYLPLSHPGLAQPEGAHAIPTHAIPTLHMTHGMWHASPRTDLSGAGGNPMISPGPGMASQASLPVHLASESSTLIRAVLSSPTDSMTGGSTGRSHTASLPSLRKLPALRGEGTPVLPECGDGRVAGGQGPWRTPYFEASPASARAPGVVVRLSQPDSARRDEGQGCAPPPLESARSDGRPAIAGSSEGGTASSGSTQSQSHSYVQIGHGSIHTSTSTPPFGSTTGTVSANQASISFVSQPSITAGTCEAPQQSGVQHTAVPSALHVQHPGAVFGIRAMPTRLSTIHSTEEQPFAEHGSTSSTTKALRSSFPPGVTIKPAPLQNLPPLQAIVAAPSPQGHLEQHTSSGSQVTSTSGGSPNGSREESASAFAAAGRQTDVSTKRRRPKGERSSAAAAAGRPTDVRTHQKHVDCSKRPVKQRLTKTHIASWEEFRV